MLLTFLIHEFVVASEWPNSNYFDAEEDNIIRLVVHHLIESYFNASCEEPRFKNQTTMKVLSALKTEARLLSIAIEQCDSNICRGQLIYIQ